MMAPRGSSRSPRRAPPARGLRPPAPRAWRWLLHCARLLIVACTLQLSGGSHLLVNALCGADAACIDICAGPCDDDADDHGCPPGCPDCSCPHGRLPSLPPSLEPTLPARLAWDLRDAWTPYRPGVPPSPPLPSLYRPPRA